MFDGIKNAGFHVSFAPALNPALGACQCCPQRMSLVKFFHTSECSASLTPIIWDTLMLCLFNIFASVSN